MPAPAPSVETISSDISLRWITGSGIPIRTEADFGYRINFAALHRAYLRYLQAELIDLVAQLESGEDGAWKNRGAAGSLGKLFRDYGTSPITSNCIPG
ncbi:hypothetical protein VTH82DRAFT_1547 [Thermothelomyces myriococcoides]